MSATKTGKRTLRVTVDGQEFTRTTDADYTHVVCGKRGVRPAYVASWHKSERAARKAAEKYAANKWNVGLAFSILPVT